MVGGSNGITTGIDSLSLGGNEGKTAKQAFLDTFKTMLDDKISVSGGAFVPYLTAIFEGMTIIGWEKVEGEENTYLLKLGSPYKRTINSWNPVKMVGKTYYFEQTILFKLVPDALQIIYPEVKKIYDAAPEPAEGGSKYVQMTSEQVNAKNLKAMWATQLGYSGAPWMTELDASNNFFITHSISDAPKVVAMKETPRIRTISEAINEMEERTAEAVKS